MKPSQQARLRAKRVAATRGRVARKLFPAAAPAELRAVVRESRLLPLRGLLDTCRSFIRHTALATRRHVAFVVDGDDVEMDQGMLERIEAPLLHLLRNALTQGIESARERVLSRKEPSGAVRLEARQEGDVIRLTVSDDGRGFDLPALIERGAGHGADRELGLDIVRASVESAGGTLHVATEPSVGTTCTLRVPSTLSVQRALPAQRRSWPARARAPDEPPSLARPGAIMKTSRRPLG